LRSSPASDSKTVQSAGFSPSTQAFPARSAQRCLSPYLQNINLSRAFHASLLRQNHKNNQLAALFQTVSLALSSPPLGRQALADAKVYLFLLIPSASSTAKSTLVGSKTNHPNARQREKIVGCVIAQPIATAMRVIQTVDLAESSLGVETDGTERNYSGETLVHNNNSPFLPSTAHASSKENLITVDVSTSLYCSPEPLPTPLGIPRMFVSCSYRRLGIASRLLSAAADNFIHGVTLDPAKGEVAFTQPTSSGKALMEKWAKKGARIYRE
jgi:N-acetyltransferase